MKNNVTPLLLTFSIVLLFNRCNKSTSDKEPLPEAPSSLFCNAASSSKINMTWNDNSSNETGFRIERKSGSGTYSVIATVNADSKIYSDSNLNANTSYTYRVFSFNSTGLSVNASNENTATTFKNPTPPIVVTQAAINIKARSVTCSGSVSGDAGFEIPFRGICWGTSANPVLNGLQTLSGMGYGDFSSEIKDLTPNTTYYFRAYAINNAGLLSFGNEFSFKTLPEANLASVLIRNQVWTTINLDVTTYRNGDPIPQVTDPAQWATLKTGAWCYYDNDPSTGPTYGKLYNWYAVNDPRGLAPVGWHIPTNDEWITVTTSLNGSNSAGGNMKATVLWNPPNTGANNSSGFTALPGGLRNTNGTFNHLNYYGFWWSATLSGVSNPNFRAMNYNDASIVWLSNFDASAGFSVRCIRNE